MKGELKQVMKVHYEVRLENKDVDKVNAYALKVMEQVAAEQVIRGSENYDYVECLVRRAYVKGLTEGFAEAHEKGESYDKERVL